MYPSKGHDFNHINKRHLVMGYFSIVEVLYTF
jgi:hypothetical protein